MLEVRNLHTGYGGMDVIHGIDIAVGAGEIVALVGANGAGKSTLVKTISGLMPVRVGEILFEGERIDRLSPTARVLKGIAQVPEGRQVFGGLTVVENLRLGAYVHRHALSEAELERRMREVCERFPILLERRGEQVANLSGGQQQMLVIARGLMAKPRLLILDEPSLGLAPVLVGDIFRLIAELRTQGGVSIMLSEQNAKLSLAIADRAYVIETGRVALAGTGKELLASPEVAERYLGVGHAVTVADAAKHAQLVGRLKDIFGAHAKKLPPHPERSA
jgi:branched-chain amino acid transport system ATP-binding protein